MVRLFRCNNVQTNEVHNINSAKLTVKYILPIFMRL